MFIQYFVLGYIKQCLLLGGVYKCLVLYVIYFTQWLCGHRISRYKGGFRVNLLI
ncbi:hypothetical protein D050_1123 [Vibrio parahaemolyticus VPCR-2009]|nr:hypothetical protein D050_1123 [Vibrio parahaemolyticus VPCR-2009]